MQIDLGGLNFKLTPSITRHIERRVHLALGWASDWINGVMVRVGDINGPRGGVDKRCRMVLWLHNRQTITVQADHADLYAAVDAASAKLRRILPRRLARRRTLHREYANRRLWNAMV